MWGLAYAWPLQAGDSFEHFVPSSDEGFPSFCLCASFFVCFVQRGGRRLCHLSKA